MAISLLFLFCPLLLTSGQGERGERGDPTALEAVLAWLTGDDRPGRMRRAVPLIDSPPLSRERVPTCGYITWQSACLTQSNTTIFGVEAILVMFYSFIGFCFCAKLGHQNIKQMGFPWGSDIKDPA